MKFNADKWVANYKKVVEQTEQKPSAGIVCALASLVTLKQGLIDDVGAESEAATAIREGINELIEQLTGENAPETKGFACNASAAAKAAGFKGEDAKGISGIKGLLE